jgi:putative ABC transport system permease protein
MRSDWLLRLRSLFKHRAVEQELDDELRFHFEHLVASHMERGVPHDDAVRRARLEFGGLDQIKENHRDARGIRVIHDLERDVRYAVRQLTRSPGFAALAVLSLGLGIGVNTSIFGALNAIFLRPMPVTDPDRVIVLTRGQQGGFSYPIFRDLQARSRVLAGLTASFPMESDLDVQGESEFVAAEVVSANYGEVLGVRMSVGKWFTSDIEPTAVISHAAWQSRFHLRPDVLGQRIGSEAQSYTVVGVTAREFTGIFAPFRTDLWVPLRTRPVLAARLEDRVRRPLMVFGRLRPDATALEASAELNIIDAQLRAEHGPANEPPLPIVVEPARGIPNPATRRLVRTGAMLLMATVGLVLLIACVNVANLLLVRGALRQRELAVRRALGATTRRLMRQLLTESLVLAVGGGICGVILALWTNEILERALPSFRSMFPIQVELSLDWRVIAFAVALSLLTTLVCGLLPAWRTSRASGIIPGKREIGAVTGRGRPIGLVSQVVLSFALLLLAGSVLEAFRDLQVTDPGFQVAGRLYAYIFFPSAPTPEAGRQLYAATLDHVKALPGVRSATLTSTLPLTPSGSDCASLPSGPQTPITTTAVDVNFFETMGIEIVEGRAFTTSDLSPDSSTVIISESFARQIWRDEAAVGERVMIGCERPQPAVVMGVVRDSAVRTIGEPPQAHLYRPFARQYSGGLTAILLETSTDPAAIVATVRQTLVRMGHGIRVYTVQPLSLHVEQSYNSVRLQAVVLTSFSLLALLLAAIGLYGVIAYRVSLRTQEIGVRMALGARRVKIFQEVVWYGVGIVLVGVAIGELLMLPLTRAAGSIQAGIRPTDLSTHIAVGLVWIGIACLACYLPAARAARVDPVVALRHE